MNPQRAGRALFIPWAAGLVVQAVLMRVAAVFSGALGEHGIYAFIAVALAAHAWQAWLLFRPGGRFAVWAALPLLGLVMSGNIQWVQMQGIIVPLVETALLAKVRLRPWAWLLAGMGQVIVGHLGSTLVNNLSAQPATASVGVSILWLACELAAAAVLAKWVTPAPQR